MYISEIKGVAVLDKNAKALGKIEDLDFSPEDGQIKGIVVSLKKNIFSKDQIEVPFDDIAAIGDYVILKNELPKHPEKPTKVEKKED